MKYILSWEPMIGGSAADCEAAQARILDLFQKWKMPESLKFQQFLVRVGEYGGYAVLETDRPADLHRAATVFATFKFRCEPVLDIQDAVAAESEAIRWRQAQR
jgi:hypothetical protein